MRLAVGYIGIYDDITEHKRMEDALQASQEQLRAYSRRLVEALENERRAIARELHDVSGQVLTAPLLSLGALKRRADCSPDLG